jgi:predicted MFS family arabinose efflux permease
VLPVLVSHVLDVLEWRATLRLIALAIALVALPILPWLARSRPRVPRATGVATQETVPGLTVAAGLRRRDFWLLALVQILTGLSFQQVYVYIIPYLLTAGYTADRAALFFGAANATSMGGFFLFGFLADRIGPRRAFVGGLLVCGLSAPLLLEAGKVSAAGFPVAAFALLWGATSSLSSQLVPLLLAGAVGQRAFAPLLGISFVMYGISMSLGALLTGYLVDRTHAFTVPFLLAGVLMLIGVFPTLGVRATAYETGGRSDAVRDRDAISPVGL